MPSVPRCPQRCQDTLWETFLRGGLRSLEVSQQVLARLPCAEAHGRCLCLVQERRVVSGPWCVRAGTSVPAPQVEGAAALPTPGGLCGEPGAPKQLLPLDAATLVLQVCCVQGCAMACRCEAIAFT